MIAGREQNNLEVVRVPQDGRGPSDKGLSQAGHSLTDRTRPEIARNGVAG
jgi:hypothetical protein